MDYPAHTIASCLQNMDVSVDIWGITFYSGNSLLPLQQAATSKDETAATEHSASFKVRYAFHPIQICDHGVRN